MDLLKASIEESKPIQSQKIALEYISKYITIYELTINDTIKITDKGIALVCKNFAHKHYHLNPDELMIFQKLSGQEQVLLAALDYLEK